MSGSESSQSGATATGTTSSTAAPTAPAAPGAGARPVARSLRVLVYSDDVATREAVRLAVGRRPARDVEVGEWYECATSDAVLTADPTRIDLYILDGEAVPYGGLGVCRELKHSVYECPPVIVLVGRPQDGWLASWSYADRAVSLPVDPVTLCEAVADLGRDGTPTQAADPSARAHR